MRNSNVALNIDYQYKILLTKKKILVSILMMNGKGANINDIHTIHSRSSS